MKILCLVKQIPRPDAIEFDPETKTLKREGVPLELNPFDAYALAEAVRLREANGGEVLAMTMGPPQSEECLRECLARGADRCVHLSDRVFAVADTIGTSRTLALAIRKEGADLVLCGRKTLDSETWQVPPEVAAFLDWPHVTSVVGLDLGDGRLRARGETTDGERVYEVALPAVCSIAATASGLEVAAPAAAADGRIALWTASDLVPDVRPNDKRFGQTGSPTRVLAVRDATPERARSVASSPQDAAELIAARLAETTKPASPWEKPERLGEQPGASYDCWTLVELVGGRPSRASLELLGKGRELAGKLGGRNIALVLGDEIEAAAAALVRYGAELVCMLDDPALGTGEPEVWVGALRQVLERERPHVLLIPATPHGRDIGPRAAGELELGMTADCVDLGIDRAGRLIQHKPAYGGNIVSVIMGATTPQLATVRPRMFEPVEPRDDVSVEYRRLELEAPREPRARIVEERPEEPPPYLLDEADVVVGVGVAVGEYVREVEEIVHPIGAVVGGDRAACSAGVVPKSRHIGLLGRAVAPRLYLALETGEDFEHATGTVKAGVIAAVGAGGSAPADVVLPGAWREALPPLVAALAGRL